MATLTSCFSPKYPIGRNSWKSSMVSRVTQCHQSLHWQSASVVNRWDFHCNTPCLETSNQAAQAGCFPWFDTVHPIARQWQEIAELSLLLTIISGVLHFFPPTATSQGAGGENGLWAVSRSCCTNSETLQLVICESSPGWIAYILACYWKYPKQLPQHLPPLLILNSTFFPALSTQRWFRYLLNFFPPLSPLSPPALFFTLTIVLFDLEWDAVRRFFRT